MAVIVENKTSGLKFLFRAVKPIDDTLIQPTIGVPLVNTKQKIHFRFIGQSEELSINFVLWDDNTDVSLGTNPTPVITLAAQIQYLKNSIFTPQFDDDFELEADDFVLSTDKLGGVITRLSMSKNTPNVATGSITFEGGDVVG